MGNSQTSPTNEKALPKSFLKPLYDVSHLPSDNKPPQNLPKDQEFSPYRFEFKDLDNYPIQMSPRQDDEIKKEDPLDKIAKGFHSIIKSPKAQNIDSPKKEVNIKKTLPDLPPKTNEKENFSPSQELKNQLPHIKEKMQKNRVLTKEEGKNQLYPKFIESRMTKAVNEINPDKGFYNEGLAISKEPPKKVNFNITSNANTFTSGMINLDEVRQNATFSKHIFEDKTIIEVLEKKMGVKSMMNTDGDLDNFDWKGKQKNIMTEKKGKVVIEKGEHHSDPYARFGHIIFKILSLISYLVLTSSTSEANLIYQILIIFSALDFWIVKNVSARFFNLLFFIEILKFFM